MGPAPSRGQRTPVLRMNPVRYDARRRPPSRSWTRPRCRARKEQRVYNPNKGCARGVRPSEPPGSRCARRLRRPRNSRRNRTPQTDLKPPFSLFWL
jgi:hypothetical protein